MFSSFENKKKRNDLLCNWKITIDASYTLISNNDSWQFVNENESRILYFSILKVTGDPSIFGEVLKTTRPSITITEHGVTIKEEVAEGFYLSPNLT